MFTGIISEIGIIKSIVLLAQGLEIKVESTELIKNLNLGDSIAINGVCSTVTNLNGRIFTVQYSPETLSKTRIEKYRLQEQVNLELSLTPNSRIGGHFVTGHIDTIGKIIKKDFKQDFGEIVISFDPQFSNLLVEKGSICIDGISLTVNKVEKSSFSCNIISHTYKNTNLINLKPDTLIHLEFDLLGKYVYRFYTNKNSNNDDQLLNTLKKAGFVNEQ
ncbi:riboflavin synthase [Candidatus Margulisiibacteriota bacterium]